jgi:hypothetical protein
MKHASGSLGRIAALIVVAFGIWSGQADAQATRTWVSGVGDDANPCSRTAPCKTFAGAISKTAAGGEIDALDPAGYGAVTITKSITINGLPFQAGVLVSGTNGVVINAATTDTVVLRGLDFVGLGTGLSAVSVVAAKEVVLQNLHVSDFTVAAVSVTAPSAVNLVMDDVTISKCTGATAAGVSLKPAAGGLVKAMLNRVRVANCPVGIIAAPAAGVVVDALVDQSDVTFATTGFLADGATATLRLSNSNVFANATGLSAINGGSIISYNNNRLRGNTTDGSPTTTVYQR